MITVALLIALGALMGPRSGWIPLSIVSLMIAGTTIGTCAWQGRDALTGVLLLLAYLSALQGGYLLGAGIFMA